MADSRLARSGNTSALGKRDRRLDILVSEETENAVVAMAALHGVPKGELARDILERALFGEFSLLQRAVQSNGRNVG